MATKKNVKVNQTTSAKAKVTPTLKASPKPVQKNKIKAPSKTEHRSVQAEIVEDDDAASEIDMPLVEAEDDSNAREVVEISPVQVETKGLTSTDPLALYLNEIRKYPLLTREKIL